MKILKTLCLLAFAAVMPAMLTSCDDDDEPSSSASSSYSGPYFGLRDCGKVISSIEESEGRINWNLTFVYDGSGRVVEVKEGFANHYFGSISYDYNSQTGNDWLFHEFSFDADANGRFNSLTRESYCENIDDEFKYNSDGNVIQVVERYYEEEQGEWIGWYETNTFIWDGDLLTSVRCSKRNDNDFTKDYEMKITYSDVDNKYRIPLCGLNTMLFGEAFPPHVFSIAPAKLPKKIEYYEPGEGEFECACRYTLDDEGFIESMYIEGNGTTRYTYADKEF